MTAIQAERIRTPEEVKADLAARGITVRAWSRANGVSEAIVHGLLSGRRKGRYGQAHRAAVLLGLKAGVAENRPAVMVKASTTTPVRRCCAGRGGA